MAKKTRPTFSVPSTPATPQAAGAPWVYRTDATPAITTPSTPPARPVRAAAPARSSGIVNCAARLLFPVALVTGFILDPLTACCRRKA